tara:strand:+ start:679 stop:927 length:249 start_codon:yes stop_codon:yes gene_type:complete
VHDSAKIIEALKKGVVTIVFEKIDTKEIRTMPCTLNNEISGQQMIFKNYQSEDTILAWALDKKAWRDVRVSTIIKWYEGESE